MKMSDFSIDRPVTITMIVLAIILIGVISLNKLSLDLMPDIDTPFLMIRTTYDGASPEEIEETVTRPIEEAVATVDGLDTLSSTSSEGSSLVKLEMEYGTDTDESKNDLRDLISRIEDSLPDDAEDPQILSFDPNSEPIIEVAISGTDLETLKNLAEDKFKTSLEKIIGVASVEVTGGLEREIQIEVDQEELISYGLTLDDIRSSITAATSNISVGSVDEGDKEISVRAIGKFDNLDLLENLIITTSTGIKVKLSDIALVKDGYEDVDEYSYLFGKSSIGLSVLKQSGSNTVQVAKKVKQELERLKKEMPELNVEVTSDESQFIEASISNVKANFILGGILAVVILWIFLRNIRSTIIIATAIPVSVITAFALMYFGDLSLNMMTLGGLALGIGMLVDNAIVVLESIYRHRQGGKARVKAAKEGTAEVGTAVLASTLTTAAVFLPIVFIEDMLAQIFTPLALTVTFSLLASLFVALTFIPMLSSKLLQVKQGIDTKDKNGMINKGYKSILRWSLNHKYLVMGILFIAVIFFGIGLKTGTIPLKMEYMPKTDQGSISVYVQLPKNTKTEKTDTIVKEVESSLYDIPEMELIYSSVSDNSGTITLELVDLDQRDRSVTEVAEEIRNKVADIPGADINVVAQTSMMGRKGRGGSEIEVTIKGSGLDTLMELSQKVLTEVKATEGTRNIAVSLEDSRPEFQIITDEKLAKELGFTRAEIASVVKTALAGSTVAQYTDDGEEYDILLKLKDSQTNSINKLKNILLTSSSGVVVPLSQIVEIESAKGPNEIERENQEKIVTVGMDIYARSLNEVQQDVETRINNLSIPSGYSIDYGGDAGDMNDSFKQLAFAMVLAVILVYMVMASQFESLIYPFVIMFTVPLALLGAVLGLSITGVALSVYGFIGIIMLAGIVVNNAIVMIDYINHRRQEEDRDEAILNAGPIRLRPIMMTTLTTVLGLLPLSFGMGDGGETQQAMAIVVIAGLLFSTILTLVIIPVLYSIVDDISNIVKRSLKRVMYKEESSI
jgi:HAE1 family hydrophobic/amphiphilic exporter-1